MYNSGDLLCIQTRLLLQSETDRKQVRWQNSLSFTSTDGCFFSTANQQQHCKNLVAVTVLWFVFTSYKVPAKADGVDYVRTEDEVGTAVKMLKLV